MFDIGFWELAVIGVVALLVVGPERMPGLIRTAGQWAGQIQRLARDLRREIEREAHTDEFRKLNQEFLDEDRRLKESVRNAADPAAEQGPVITPDDEHARVIGEDNDEHAQTTREHDSQPDDGDPHPAQPKHPSPASDPNGPPDDQNRLGASPETGQEPPTHSPQPHA